MLVAGTGRRVGNQAASRRSPDQRGPKAVPRGNWREAGLPNRFLVLKESHPREGGATTGDDLEPGKAAHNPPKEQLYHHGARLTGMPNASWNCIKHTYLRVMVVVVMASSSSNVLSAKNSNLPGAVFYTFHADPRLSPFCFLISFQLSSISSRGVLSSCAYGSTHRKQIMSLQHIASRCPRTEYFLKGAEAFLGRFIVHYRSSDGSKADGRLRRGLLV